MKGSVIAALVVWFAAAVLFVSSGAFARTAVPPPAFVAILGATTVAVTLSVKSLRSWVMAVDVRALLVVHLVRFVGVAFLLLVSRGVLSQAFTPIGWGDTVAACGAVLLLLIRPVLSSSRGWWMVLAWNVIGFGDMLLLIVTGIRLGRVAPEQFALFRELPFGLLPTFFVPLIIATHLFIFVRLFARRES